MWPVLHHYGKYLSLLTANSLYSLWSPNESQGRNSTRDLYV